MGADAIYATNANRKFATLNNIRTDFCRKGRAGKHEASRKQLASMITKERASSLSDLKMPLFFLSLNHESIYISKQGATNINAL